MCLLSWVVSGSVWPEINVHMLMIQMDSNSWFLWSFAHSHGELHVSVCKTCLKNAIQFLSGIIRPLSPSVCVSLSGSATFLSRNQSGRHSMHPPSSPLDDLLSHSLTFSPFVLFHWPCMFQKQISFSSTVRHPPTPTPTPTQAPPCTITLLQYLLSKYKPGPKFLSKSTSPPHCSTSSPTLTLSSHAGIWRRVSTGCPPIPGPSGGI